MRRWCALVGVVGVAGCQTHVDFRLSMQCVPLAGNPTPPASCDQMTLGCANFIDFRVYASDAKGTLGPILESNCLPSERLGSPANLCELLAPRAPIQLLPSVPSGKMVRFRLRAMVVANPQNGCNDDLPGSQTPVVVFDGFSAAAMLDGGDHVVPIPIGFCASCADLPPPCGTGPCIPLTPNCFPSGNPNGKVCCPPRAPGCLAPGDQCADGTTALLPPGGCCAECPPS